MVTADFHRNDLEPDSVYRRTHGDRCDAVIEIEKSYSADDSHSTNAVD